MWAPLNDGRGRTGAGKSLTKLLKFPPVSMFLALLAVYLLVNAPGYIYLPAQPEAPPSYHVTIPKGAYIAPKGWRGGYVFDDRYYAPNTLVISAGDVVEWVNEDIVLHTVTFHKLPPGAGPIDSGPIEPGKAWRFKFTVPGEYEYHCQFHPWQAGKLIVKG